MRSFLKTLTLGLFFVIIIGVCFCIYIFHAPPVPKPESPKLQVHKRTAVRRRPTVNSKPIFYTKDVFLFNLDKKYISNLNMGQFKRDLLFSVALGQRARFSTQLLDKELKSVFNWHQMFADADVGIQLSSGTPTVEVLLSGQDWLLTDKTGAGYAVQKIEDQLDIYLPNLRDAFNNNRKTLSADVKLTIEKKGKEWLIQDNKTRQAYEIRNATKKLNVHQQSKFPIETFLFRVDLASMTALTQGKFSEALRQGFKNQEIQLSHQYAKLIPEEDGVSWRVTDENQKYNIINEDGWLKVYLNLESKWLLVRADNKRGWVQSERGTIFMAPQPILSSRQQLKEKFVVFIDRLKGKDQSSNQPDEDQIVESPQ